MDNISQLHRNLTVRPIKAELTQADGVNTPLQISLSQVAQLDILSCHLLVESHHRVVQSGSSCRRVQLVDIVFLASACG